MEWHTTLSSNHTQKNNKQEELAMRSWKHRPHSQLCLWSFTFLFNTDVVLFLAYDLCAIPCRWWRSEDHCCGVCSLDTKKETVNEWNKMSTPFGFFKDKSKQARYWILLGFMCIRKQNQYCLLNVFCQRGKERGSDLRIKIFMMFAKSRWCCYILF